MGKLICSLCKDGVEGSLITHWYTHHKYWFYKSPQVKRRKGGKIVSGVK